VSYKRAVIWVVTDVSEELTVFILRVMNYPDDRGSRLF
jgi:hypothetical protein